MVSKCGISSIAIALSLQSNGVSIARDGKAAYCGGIHHFMGPTYSVIVPHMTQNGTNRGSNGPFDIPNNLYCKSRRV